MSATIAETARQYSLANGGHATVAASIAVPPHHLVAYVSGKSPPTRQLAVALAPLLGIPAFRILGDDPDRQLLSRKGVLP
jgi:hypothetical protein